MKHNRFFYLVLLMGMSLILVWTHPILADTSGEASIDLDLSPESSLFDVANMKPGDWASRTVTVTNAGKQDFDYKMQLQGTGNDKLFAELLLDIKIGDDKLYSGKLADLQVVHSSLVENAEEDMEMTLRFPDYLGNKFQGMKTTFSFLFTAEGSNNATDQAEMNGMVDSGDGGSQLPTTATDMFVYFLVGIVTVGCGLLGMILHHKRKNKSLTHQSKGQTWQY